MLGQDLRYATRVLRKSPGFSIVALLTLGVGIGANVGIFSFVDALLLEPLPYANADRIVRVLERPPRGERNGISTLNFLDWQKDNTVFDFMAAQAGGTVTLTGGAEPVQLRGGRVSADYFRIFGVDAALGRTFRAGEDTPGNHRVVVLSHVFWTSHFGADPAVVNSTILLDHQPHTVVGILPQGSAFDRAAIQIWRPLAFEPSNMTRDFHWLTSFARLKPGVSLEQAQAAMDVIGARIARDFPASNKGWGVIVEDYAGTIVGPQNRSVALVLIAATGLVLLIGCANLANLALARALAREREVVVRASIGASRRHLVRQFLTENVLLAVCGGLLGVAVGHATMRGMLLLMPPFSFPREIDIAMDGRVLLFALLLSVVTGVLFGMAPALQASRPDLAAAIKDDSRTASGGTSRKRLRDALIVAEVALAFVLLVGSGLLIRSFIALMNVDTGFDSTNLLTMRLPATTEQYPDPAALNRYLSEVRAAVEAVPGVRATAYSCAPPLQGTCYGMPMQPMNQPVVDMANRSGGFFKVVSPSYFSTLGIRRYFEQEDPIGQRILIQEIVPGRTELGADVSWEVVGVIGDEKIGGPADIESAGVYVSHEQSPVYGMVLSVRASVNPLTLQAPITAAIRRVNKDQAITDVRTVDEIRDLSMGGRWLGSVLLGTFSAVALVLAGIGIYGVVSYSVTQRTRELGIRAALGASHRSLMRLVLDHGLRLTTIGLVIGLGGALALTRLMATMLFGVGARDPVTMTVTALALAAVAVLASYVPARRATKVDPLIALRYE